MTIWLPPSHAIHNKGPKYACCLCDAVFFEDERHVYERHVMRAHSHEEVRQHSPQVAAPGIFDPHHESGDVEWQKWIDRNQAERPEDWQKWMRTSEQSALGAILRRGFQTYDEDDMAKRISHRWWQISRNEFEDEDSFREAVRNELALAEHIGERLGVAIVAGPVRARADATAPWYTRAWLFETASIPAGREGEAPVVADTESLASDLGFDDDVEDVALVEDPEPVEAA